ncbi:hypothetical protein [Sagittula sp. P11]|uniref:hypothetical protein n=1 Tax=Sagittula sp. P11 TaxID=2009329 RepID=UPI0012FD29A7|nr:hypothetical protein [Sagittula sp. P11]
MIHSRPAGDCGERVRRNRVRRPWLPRAVIGLGTFVSVLSMIASDHRSPASGAECNMQGTARCNFDDSTPRVKPAASRNTGHPPLGSVVVTLTRASNAAIDVR